MPAVMRGAGRSSAKARSKSSASPLKSRPAPTRGVAAQGRFAVTPGLAFGVSGLAVAGVLVIALATDHRGERLVRHAGDAAIQATAALGFRLQTVRLDGASAQSSADILRAAALPRGAPLFAIDLDAVRHRIEQVGWVKSATVIRLYPDSVVIAVEERHLMAVWQSNGRVGVIDTGGAWVMAMAQRVRAARGADFSICDIDLPVQVTPAP